MKIFRVGINRISITELETSPVIGSISCSVIGWLQGCSKNHKDIYQFIKGYRGEQTDGTGSKGAGNQPHAASHCLT